MDKKPGQSGSQVVSGLVPGLTSVCLVVMLASGRETHLRSGLEQLRFPHSEGSVGGIIHKVTMVIIPIDLEKANAISSDECKR